MSINTDTAIVQRYLPSHGNGVVTVKTPPEVEPITLDQFKLFARIDGTYEDTNLELLLSTAVIGVEDYLKKALIERTFVLSMDWWPEPLQLPYPPLLSIVEVRTLDEESIKTVYSSDSYFVRTNNNGPGEIIIKNGVTPPVNTSRFTGGYEVEYKAGYGGDPLDVPASIRHGILLLATFCYENRVPILTGTIMTEVPGLKEALGMKRRIRI